MISFKIMSPLLKFYITSGGLIYIRIPFTHMLIETTKYALT